MLSEISGKAYANYRRVVRRKMADRQPGIFWTVIIDEDEFVGRAHSGANVFHSEAEWRQALRRTVDGNDERKNGTCNVAGDGLVAIACRIANN